MLPGSATRMLVAATVQAHQPTTNEAAISQPMPAGESQFCSTRYASQAQSVPAVPGATGLKPEPKPRAMKWAGWESRNLESGLRGGCASGPGGAMAASSVRTSGIMSGRGVGSFMRDCLKTNSVTPLARHIIMKKLLLPFVRSTVLILLVAGCVAPLQTGATREEAITRYGAPSRVVALPSGTRLQYSGQPSSQSVIMVDLDAAGRVVAVNEVMNPRGFERVVVNQSTRADVERELGPPAVVDHVGSWKGDILNYRWRDAGFDMLFYVYLDPGNVVRRTGQGMEIRSKGLDD